MTTSNSISVKALGSAEWRMRFLGLEAKRRRPRLPNGSAAGIRCKSWFADRTSTRGVERSAVSVSLDDPHLHAPCPTFFLTWEQSRWNMGGPPLKGSPTWDAGERILDRF